MRKFLPYAQRLLSWSLQQQLESKSHQCEGLTSTTVCSVCDPLQHGAGTCKLPLGAAMQTPSESEGSSTPRWFTKQPWPISICSEEGAEGSGESPSGRAGLHPACTHPCCFSPPGCAPSEYPWWSLSRVWVPEEVWCFCSRSARGQSQASNKQSGYFPSLGQEKALLPLFI